jgi:hypothetical protein
MRIPFLIALALSGPFTDLLGRVSSFLVNFATMLLIVVLGLVGGWAIKWALGALLKATRFDRFGHRIGFADALRKAGVRTTPTGAVVAFVYWIILFSVFMLALHALQVQALERLIADFFAFLPRLVAALLVLFAGHLVSLFLARTVLLAAVNAGIQFARLLALGVQLLVLFFFVAMALTQMGIASGIVVATFSILLGGVVLAFALAFGLGARDLAKDLLEKQLARRQEEEQKEEKEPEEKKGFEEFHPL